MALGNWPRNTVRDLRFAVRQLRRAPGFAMTVVITLALGVGATTIVYSIVDAVLLRPLPFPQPEKLVAISSMESLPGGAERVNDVSYPNFFDWRAQAKSFASMASYKADGYTLGGANGAAATRTTGVLVSSDFFSTLGVNPVLGRGFLRSEEQAGNRSVVIGHDLWQSRFNGSPDVIGKSLQLNEQAYTVVGVMPAGFQYPLSATDAQLWVTLATDAEGEGASATQRGYNQLDVVGRLRDGVSLEQAHAELNAIQAGLASRYPDEDKQMTAVQIMPQTEALLGDVRGPLRILFAAVCILLLIACANTAGLLLTRAASRAGELSVRSALGARRMRIVQQLLSEALVLSVAGGGLGMILAAAALKLAPHYLPPGLIRAQQVAVSGNVLLFALAVSLGTGILFGLFPAWRMSGQSPILAMREGSRGTTAGRQRHLVHNALVIVQTALGVVLLAGAGLLMLSFDRMMSVEPGFDPSHLLTFRVAVPDSRYSNEQRVALYNRLLERLKGVPGVRQVTAGFPLPLSGGNIRISFAIEGQPVAAGDEPSERVSLIAPDFFETLRIPMREGRDFSASEHAASGQPVVIVNQAFARKYFGSADAIGQHLRSGLGAGNPSPMREIVGVVADVKRASLTEKALPEYYIPIEQAPVAPPPVAMRVEGDPAQYQSAVQAAVASLDGALPVYRMHPVSDDLIRTTAQQRFQTILVGSFALIALLLAAVGLYALLSYMVTQRKMELGLRIALGAQRQDVLGLILTRGLGLAGIGLALGVSASFFATRLLASMLFQVDPHDGLALAGASLVLITVALMASLFPALRASQLDPVETLRSQ